MTNGLFLNAPRSIEEKLHIPKHSYQTPKAVQVCSVPAPVEVIKAFLANGGEIGYVSFLIIPKRTGRSWESFP